MANELSALVEVGGEAVDRLVMTPAESLHLAIAERVFRSTAPLSAPSRFVHNRIARAAYGSTRLVTRGVTSLAASSLRRVTGDDLRPLSASIRGRAAISALNALIGDRLTQDGSPLAIKMAIRARGVDVSCEPEALRRAFPRPTARIAVFLHGLGETEERWRRGRRGGKSRKPFGRSMRRDFGLTTVEVRYNTGLHISDNGRQLSELLENLVDAWPMKVEEIIFVGHSMGGLVARSACHAGRTAGCSWPVLARHLIALGSPHTGVPLEKTVHAAAWALRAIPETRPIARILDMRSAGIRDLRFGYVTEEDWSSEDPDRLLDDRRSDITPLDGCRYTFITATVTRDVRHPLGRLGGDLLVRTESAAGRRRDGSVVVPAHQVIDVGAMSHFDLLDHPVVYAHIRNVLASRPQPAA